MADIDLSFGVSGGGSIDAGSGKAIKDALENIIREVTKESVKIRVEVDPSSITNFKTQLTDLTSHAKTQAAAIQAAYAGIQFPKVPTPGSGNGSTRKPGLIKVNSNEMTNALAELKKYQVEIDKILKGSSAAATGSGQRTYQELEQINSVLKVYEGLISQGCVRTDAFAADMEHVAATIRLAKAEFKLLGENVDNHLIPKDSTEMFDSLAQLQSYRKQIKQMQEEWTAASQKGAKSFDAMQNLAAQGTALEGLEAKLRAGQIGANDLAVALERAGAVIKQTSAEVKFHGENKGLIDFDVGTKAHTKALEDVSKLLVKTRKDYEAWTAAAKGPTAASYSGLKDQISLLENLHKQLVEGKISWQDYEKSISRIKSNIAGFSGDIKAAGKDTKSFGDSVGGLIGKFTKWLSVSQIVMKTIQTVKQMVTTVTAIDTAMTELRKVTDATDTAYEKFLSNSVVRAKSLGATLTDVVTATADFAKLGYSISEASSLADAAIVYKNVGDNIESIDTAAESIISTMQAFADENHTAIEIVDKFNRVGNEYAITSTGVGEALQRSAAAMNAAGNDLDQTIALITAANTIVQNPESVGKLLPNNTVMHCKKTAISVKGRRRFRPRKDFVVRARGVRSSTGFLLYTRGDNYGTKNGRLCPV